VTRTGPPAAVTAPDGTPRRRAWARALASRPVAKVIGAGRLALMAVTAVVATLVAVLVIGPWGWTSGIAVSHGAPITGPVPQPSAEPGVLYTSPDGSLSIPDPTLDGDDHTIRFDVTAEVGADHSVTVTEDIAESFAAYRHGIERDIPLRDAAGEHAMRSLVVSADAGTPDNVSVLEGTGFDGVTVRIGDPDRTITGVHRYRLTYVLENVVSDPHSAAAPTAEVLHATPGGPTTRQTVPPATPVDRVALDAFSAWRQPVYGTTYVVKGPQGVVGGLCTQGSEFYRVDCASTTLAADGATFSSAAPVQAYNDVTIQVDWPKGTFGPAVVDGPERGTWPVRLLAMGLSLVGVVVVAGSCGPAPAGASSPPSAERPTRCRRSSCPPRPGSTRRSSSCPRWACDRRSCSGWRRGTRPTPPDCSPPRSSTSPRPASWSSSLPGTTTTGWPGVAPVDPVASSAATRTGCWWRCSPRG
jgi:hypothetical protein